MNLQKLIRKAILFVPVMIICLAISIVAGLGHLIVTNKWWDETKEIFNEAYDAMMGV